jgi:hypothetical protein
MKTQNVAPVSAGLNKMLLAPVDDRNRSVVLFPSWPSERWNVRFKLQVWSIIGCWMPFSHPP